MLSLNCSVSASSFVGFDQFLYYYLSDVNRDNVSSGGCLLQRAMEKTFDSFLPYDWRNSDLRVLRLLGGDGSYVSPLIWVTHSTNSHLISYVTLLLDSGFGLPSISRLRAHQKNQFSRCKCLSGRCSRISPDWQHTGFDICNIHTLWNIALVYRYYLSSEREFKRHSTTQRDTSWWVVIWALSEVWSLPDT
jgi:hypothetical protein